jgi:hypothetical protein
MKPTSGSLQSGLLKILDPIGMLNAVLHGLSRLFAFFA